jgi:hypothetical protein
MSAEAVSEARREQLREACRRYRARNLEEMRERDRDYYAAHSGYILRAKRVRRAGPEGDHMRALQRPVSRRSKARRRRERRTLMDARWRACLAAVMQARAAARLAERRREDVVAE